MPYLGNVPSSFNVGTDNINNDAITTAKIADGAILNADVNAAAAIAGTKISPDFGSQNILTTGTATAASLIPTSSTAPTNGLYLPAANNVAISTGGSGRLFVDSNGNLGVGISSIPNYNANLRTVSFNNTNGVVHDYAVNGVRTGSIVCQSTALELSTQTNIPLVFSTNSAERMRLTSTGLGIGDSAPKNTLDCAGNVGIAPTAGLVSNLYYSGGWKYKTTGYGTVVAQGTGGFKFSGTSSSGSADGAATVNDWVTIDNQGRLGIGTSTPGYLLDLSASTPVLNIASSASSGDGAQIRFVQNFGRVGRLYCTSESGNGSGSMTLESPDGRHIIFSNTSSERARIDSSGRLLVGTSSAVGTNSGTGLIVRSPVNNNHAGEILLQNAYTRPGNGSGLGSIKFQDAEGSTYSQIIGFQDGTASSSSDVPGGLTFSVTSDGASSPTERMRIGQNGYLKASNTGSYIATSNNYHELVGNAGNELVVRISNTHASSPYGVNFVFDNASPNNATNYFWNCGDSTTTRATLRSNGGLANYSANNANLSDRNAKKDISPAADTWNCIKEWQIVTYRYKDQPDDADLNLGVIAQQVAESCPEVITVFQEATEDEPEKLGVKEQQMYWMAIKALQEAQVRIEALEAEVAALKAQ